MTNGIGRVGWRSFVSAAPTNNNPLWNNLLAYYTADSTVNDSKGTANGTLINGATYSTGKINNGFSLDGINDYVNFGNNLDFNGSTPFSFSAWVKPTTLSGLNCILSKMVAATAQGYYLRLENGIRFVIYNADTSGVAVTTTTSIPLNVYTHITVTYSGNGLGNGFNIYVNGVNTTLTIVRNAFYGSASNSASFSIGSQYTGASANVFFNGVIDEVGAWSRALTATEVTELYNAGAGKQYVAPAIVTNGLLLNLDASNALSYSGTGTTWTDLSGNGNNGTLMNGTAYSSANGGTLVLDGVNDYIAFNLGNYKTMFGTITSFSTWVKYTNVSGYTTIFGDWNSGGLDETARFALNGYNNVPGKIAGYIMSAGGNGGVSSTTTILPNVWYHYSMTYDGTTQKLYVNGVLEAQSTHGITPNGSGKFAIGRGGDYSGLYAPINISNFQVYNRALSSTEVTQNFNAAKTRFGL